MTKKTPPTRDASDIFTEMLQIQGEAARQVMQTFAPDATDPVPNTDAFDAMGKAMQQLQELWLGPHVPGNDNAGAAPMLADPAAWMEAMQHWSKTMPMLDPERQQDMWTEGFALWQQILDQYQIGQEGSAPAGQPKAELPRKDRRFF